MSPLLLVHLMCPGNGDEAFLHPGFERVSILAQSKDPLSYFQSLFIVQFYNTSHIEEDIVVNKIINTTYCVSLTKQSFQSSLRSTPMSM